MYSPAELKARIRTVLDYPIEGIRFRDITTVLKDADAFQSACDQMWNLVRDIPFDKVVAIDARGFIFGGVLAYRRHAGLVIARKKGKLPAKTFQASYQLEYGQEILELHEDALEQGEKVLIVDDLLATGGTASAVRDLVNLAGSRVVGYAFFIELVDLNGREKLRDAPVFSVISFTESE